MRNLLTIFTGKSNNNGAAYLRKALLKNLPWLVWSMQEICVGVASGSIKINLTEFKLIRKLLAVAIKYRSIEA